MASLISRTCKLFRFRICACFVRTRYLTNMSTTTKINLWTGNVCRRFWICWAHVSISCYRRQITILKFNDVLSSSSQWSSPISDWGFLFNKFLRRWYMTAFNVTVLSIVNHVAQSECFASFTVRALFHCFRYNF